MITPLADKNDPAASFAQKSFTEWKQ